MEHLLLSAGLPLLFVLIMLESAGIPLPGETALIAAAILASRGHYRIWEVVAVAAVAAIVGDNGGDWVGRIWGR
jgi:membrane protein DedA with SNARE-associated domain